MAIGDATGGLSTSGGIYFTGIGSGTDFSTMIDKLVSVEQTRVATYQTWKQTWADKNTALKSLNTTLLSLRTTLQGMDTMNEFLKKTATSSDTDVLTATATGAADTGTCTFTVKQLAKNKVMVTTSGYSSLTQDINQTQATAKFVYTYKGVTVSNSIPAAATLTDLVNILDAQSSNTGIRASTIYDGSKYYLQFRGLDTGAASDLVISSASTLSGFTSSDFQTTQKNQDALLKLNGWPAASDAYISRASNTVSDLVDGVTMYLKSSGAGTITTETDVDSVVENVSSFVTKINTVITELQDLTKYDSTNKQGSILTGNYSLQMISDVINNITGAVGKGFSTKRDIYSSLSPLGLSTDADEGSDTFGQIVFDEDTFRAVMASNALAVGKIFSAQYLGDTDSSECTYTSFVDGITKAGTYSVNYTVSGGKLTSATINGHQATFSSNSNTITGMYGYDEGGMVLTVNDFTDGTYVNTAYVREGKFTEMVDELGDLTNSTSGPITIIENNYDDIQTNIQKKIDNENVRIAEMAQHLKDQYSRLDTLLGKYSQIQTSLSSQITQLSSS
ncbi:flagellar filament capping protein FliD [Fundidesulfovibrio terrae]|uniref:flagellar filament capping protein FliD n=1 Tax=Fundidesulfovibrio terrae TaxID=2922866 RepID=UPI001FAF735C|nr:flagellar filament capping protein FliD [Fundidesulfovibrio terrae]